MSQNGGEWEREVFVEHGMDNVAGLYLDLVQAMSASCDCNPSMPKVEDLLVSEVDE